MESKPALMLLGVVILIFAWNVLGFWNKMRETERNKEAIQEEVSALREQKEKLQNDIENLETLEGKERFFRENFGLAKEGEEVIVIVNKEEPVEEEKTSYYSSFFLFLKNLLRR